jgi:glycosyltransferase involved in cell wall biosynthesis
MSEKLLSIIIPVLITKTNKMDIFLKRCINSIATNIDVEKYKDQFEVIVVDDKSEETTAFDELDFKTLNIKVINNEENLNIGGARNVGLNNSVGKYIWYLDGDDFMENTAILRFFSNYEKTKDKDIQLFFTQFNSLSYQKDGSGAINTVSRLNNMQLINYAFCPVSSCCKIVRRDKAIRHPEKVYMEDVVFNFQQLDLIDGPENVCTLIDGAYWTYDLRRESNFTHTSHWLQTNRLTIEQHLRNNPIAQLNLKPSAISDVFRVVAGLLDIIPNLKHNNVKEAAIQRCINITDKIKCNNYTH